MKTDEHNQLVKTRDQFTEQVDLYSDTENVAKDSDVIPFLTDYFAEYKGKTKITICEFGGGGGILLNEIEKKLGNDKFKYINIELTEAYRDTQISKNIEFKTGSILDRNIEETKYDVVILRAVLHHLVGKNHKRTLANQRLAVKNLFRIVKEGGVVIIDEQIHDIPPFAYIIYHLSLLASILKIRIKRFQITPSTIVNFWSTNKLKKEVLKYAREEDIISEKHTYWNMAWYWKAIILMNKAGWLFLAIKNNN